MREARRWGLAGVLTAALAGCAGTPVPDEQAQARQETLEDILTTPMAAGEYDQGARCLSARDFRTVEVLDDRHVLFEGRRGEAWINRLNQRCLGLRRNDTLRFQRRHDRLCALDSFEAVDAFSHQWSRSSGICSLGEFQPVTPHQVEVLDAALK